MSPLPNVFSGINVAQYQLFGLWSVGYGEDAPWEKKKKLNWRHEKISVYKLNEISIRNEKVCPVLPPTLKHALRKTKIQLDKCLTVNLFSTHPQLKMPE